MIFCITIMVLGVIGNIMVPIVIFKTKDMRNSTNIFLTNLSIADLLVLLVCTPTVLVEVNTKPETWILGHEMCKAVPFVELTVAHASVLTILAISFERYYAICEPLKAGYVCTKTRALLICLIAWVVAALFTSPILSIASFQITTYIDGTEVEVCLTTVDTFWHAFYFIGSISIFFFIPFVILLVLYTIIAKHLMSNPGLISYGHRTNVLKYRKQVILMLGAVVLSFFVCLLPFRALTLWIIVVPSEKIMSLGIEAYYNILYFCRIMLYLNSAMNPILYNLMSSKFRDGFLKLIGCTLVVKRKSYISSRKSTTFHTTSTNLSCSSQSYKRDQGRNSINQMISIETAFDSKNAYKNDSLLSCSNYKIENLSLNFISEQADALPSNRIYEEFEKLTLKSEVMDDILEWQINKHNCHRKDLAYLKSNSKDGDSFEDCTSNNQGKRRNCFSNNSKILVEDEVIHDNSQYNTNQKNTSRSADSTMAKEKLQESTV